MDSHFRASSFKNAMTASHHPAVRFGPAPGKPQEVWS